MLFQNNTFEPIYPTYRTTSLDSSLLPSLLVIARSQKLPISPYSLYYIDSSLTLALNLSYLISDLLPIIPPYLPNKRKGFINTIKRRLSLLILARKTLLIRNVNPLGNTYLVIKFSLILEISRPSAYRKSQTRRIQDRSQLNKQLASTPINSSYL